MRAFFRIAACIALLAGIYASAPSDASACVFRIRDNFMPLPPCEGDDVPGTNRVLQFNAHLAAKMVAMAEVIRTTQAEISAWQQAKKQVNSWRRRMDAVYGRATAPPLPSMVLAYNRYSPIRHIVTIRDANGNISISVIDVEQEVSNAYERLKGDADAQALFLKNYPQDLVRSARADLMTTGQRAEYMLREGFNLERYVAAAKDSLDAVGREIAGRYTDWAIPDGISEARITRLGASLNRFKGTAFATRADAIQDGLNSLQGSIYNSRRATASYRYRMGGPY